MGNKKKNSVIKIHTKHAVTVLLEVVLVLLVWIILIYLFA